MSPAGSRSFFTTLSVVQLVLLWFLLCLLGSFTLDLFRNYGTNSDLLMTHGTSNLSNLCTFFFQDFFFSLKCVHIFIMYRKRVCGYLVCFKSIKKLALGRQVGEGPILLPTPAMWCTPCLKIFKKILFFFFGKSHGGV